jgi:putative Holliday junction resolvase
MIATRPPAGIPGSGRVLGVDLGSKRVGVAVSDRDQRLATGARRVDRGRDRAGDHRALAAVAADYEAVGMVVGLPLSLSGRPGPAAERALEEIKDLRRTVGVPIEVIDERLSTVAATASLRAAGRSARRQRPVIDETAAAVVLQVWLDRRASGGSSGGAHG